MDEIEFHREPPSNVPTMVVAFGGWVDAGEAATGAMRYLDVCFISSSSVESQPVCMVEGDKRRVQNIGAEG
jgi:hypothetical protein